MSKTGEDTVEVGSEYSIVCGDKWSSEFRKERKKLEGGVDEQNNGEGGERGITEKRLAPV